MKWFRFYSERASNGGVRATIGITANEREIPNGAAVEEFDSMPDAQKNARDLFNYEKQREREGAYSYAGLDLDLVPR